jgi:ATP-dependent Lon protease
MQATVDIRLWMGARAEFTLSEWRALLLLSMGYNPNAFHLSEQRVILCRLLPLVQKNAHLIELAPKGTGKSFIYENISPRVRLVSGGNISPAVLFVNNANGLPGLLARYSTVVLDEVQTLKFERPEEIVGGLKGYLANGQLTRGGLHQLASDCSLVMLANILLDSDQKPLNDPVVLDLPKFLQEPAFLDRMRGIIPGWKIRKLSTGSFANSLGLKADFFGSILLALRDEMEADQRVAEEVSLLGERVFKRNEDSVRTLTSGLLKLLFPNNQYTPQELREECVQTAVELRQIVWDQLYQLDLENRQFDYQLQVR